MSEMLDQMQMPRLSAAFDVSDAGDYPAAVVGRLAAPRGLMRERP